MKRILATLAAALCITGYVIADPGQIIVTIPAGGSTNVTFNAPRLTFITGMRNVCATNAAVTNNVVGTLTTTNGANTFTGPFIASGITTNIATSIKVNDKDALLTGSTLTFTNSEVSRISELTITIDVR